MFKEPKLELGLILMTKSIEKMRKENFQFSKFVLRCLAKHVSGDWGDLCEDDKRENDYALDKYLRIFSSYNYLKDRRIWIITEADRKSTTILFPEEY